MVHKFIFFFALAIISFNACLQHSKEYNKKDSSLDYSGNQNNSTKSSAKNYVPGFGELMGGIQVHHAKLWFAGTNDNWKLAQFEIHELNELLEDLHKYQSERKETKLLSMLEPAIEKLNSSISRKRESDFVQNYKYLTRLCNDCHKETQYEYIKIKIPAKPPVGNQEYK